MKKYSKETKALEGHRFCVFFNIGQDGVAVVSNLLIDMYSSAWRFNDPPKSFFIINFSRTPTKPD